MPPKLKDLFFTETTYVDLVTRRATMSRQWLLENRNTGDDHPISVDNNLKFYICASEAFPQIVADLRAATSSVDLICWGFDPGMELLARREGDWPRSLTYGDLLREICAKGVTVRLLVWYADGDGPGKVARMANNLPGHPKWGKPDKRSPNYLRATFCEQWWAQAMDGKIPNLHLRHRDPGLSDINANLVGENNDTALIERLGLGLVGTHHQKPILIDYDLPEQALGYVMGLNSTTDFWDTPEHIYNDARRGHQWEGIADKANPKLRLKPYRDYAIRVQGHTLHCLNRNFVTAWDRAKCNWDPQYEKVSLQAARQAIAPERFRLPSGSTRHIAQITRTQPEERDKTIQETYWLATSQARNYLYLENQYFQYTPWVEHLKDMRAKYVACMQAGGWSTDVPNLHVFIVIPEAERLQMVPRTYDTVAALGQGQTMPAYDSAVQARRERVIKPDDTFLTKLRKGGELWVQDAVFKEGALDGYLAASAKRRPVSPADLEAMGIKVLIAKLCSQDSHSAKCREIYIHSKLMIIDDVFLTLGSANMNLRSMAVDSEINISCMHAEFPLDVRKRVWGSLAGEALNGGDGSPAKIQNTHEHWINKMKDNADIVANGGGRLQDFIVTYSDSRGGTGIGTRLAQVPAATSDQEVLA